MAAVSHEPSWSLPQLLTLGFLRDHQGASLSEVAVHLGIGLPSASTLVNRLVLTGQVNRRDDPTERRRILLTLTPKGHAQLDAAIQASHQELTDRLRAVPARDLARIGQAMALLRTVFSDT